MLFCGKMGKKCYFVKFGNDFGSLCEILVNKGLSLHLCEQCELKNTFIKPQIVFFNEIII